MKILVCKDPGVFGWDSAEMPAPKKGFAIIKIRRVGICGTDLHAFQGTQPYFTYPRVLGHELSGTLVSAEDAPDGFAAGDTVTFIPYFNCGTCIACRSGKPNCCVNVKVFGVHIDGGMAEYVQVPSAALVHGEGLGFDELALVEPLAIGAHAIRRAGVTEADTVLVIGAGPIGIGVMEFARITGSLVIAMDVNANRLEFCSTRLGIKNTINTTEVNATDVLREMTGGDMATVVIDATGNLGAINNGINYLAHGGTYVLVGLQKQAFSFSHPEFHKRETTLMSSRNATREDFNQVVSAIKNGHVNVNAYISHRASFEEAATSFPYWLDPSNRVIKAMVSLDA